MVNSVLPIDMEILQKRNAIPTLLAELSYLDQMKAIEYMRIWGEKKMPITSLYEKLSDELTLSNYG